MHTHLYSSWPADKNAKVLFCFSGLPFFCSVSIQFYFATALSLATHRTCDHSSSFNSFLEKRSTEWGMCPVAGIAVAFKSLWLTLFITIINQFWYKFDLSIILSPFRGLMTSSTTWLLLAGNIRVVCYMWSIGNYYYISCWCWHIMCQSLPKHIPTENTLDLIFVLWGKIGVMAFLSIL